jgi:ribonuclease HI
MENVTLYVDGSYLQLHGCGGFAAIPLNESGEVDMTRAVVGSRASNGNQEMELLAVIEGIKSVPRSKSVTVFTDHKTICDVIAKPTRANCERGINRNMWNQLRQLCESREVRLEWVRAHCGNLGNTAADIAARAAAKRFMINNLLYN